MREVHLRCASAYPRHRRVDLFQSWPSHVHNEVCRTSGPAESLAKRSKHGTICRMNRAKRNSRLPSPILPLRNQRVKSPRHKPVHGTPADPDFVVLPRGSSPIATGRIGDSTRRCRTPWPAGRAHRCRIHDGLRTQDAARQIVPEGLRHTVTSILAIIAQPLAFGPCWPENPPTSCGSAAARPSIAANGVGTGSDPVAGSAARQRHGWGGSSDTRNPRTSAQRRRQGSLRCAPTCAPVSAKWTQCVGPP